jgi:ABC-type uncharacterized transport system fused permease/ATPase subunit
MNGAPVPLGSTSPVPSTFTEQEAASRAPTHYAPPPSGASSPLPGHCGSVLIVPCTTGPCDPVPCSPVPCAPLSGTPVPCAPVPCALFPCTPVPCTPVPCTPVPCAPHQFLFRALSLELRAGERLLVTGPDGCGKSTLAHCLAGVWRHATHGGVQLSVPRDRVVVLPQSPLAAPGQTLREQLLYPQEVEETYVDTRSELHGKDAQLLKQQQRGQLESDAELVQLLRLIGLGCLLEEPEPAFSDGSAQHGSAQHGSAQHGQQPPSNRSCMEEHGSCRAQQGPPSTWSPLDARRSDWSAALSPGQLQRLSFARALRQRPLLVVLDEATSALPERDEAVLYRLLAGTGAAIISMGHRGTLRALHNRELRIDGGGKGGWSLHDIGGTGD